MYPMASECPRYTLLLGAALVYNATLLLIAAATRRRLPRNVEWFDVWRHGRPSLNYVLKVFLPETVAVAEVGPSHQAVLGFSPS